MAKKATKPKPIQKKEAIAVLRAVDLQSIQLTDCAVRQNFKDGKLPDQIKNDNDAEIAVDESRTQIRVRFKCSLNGSYGEPKGNQSLDDIPLLIGATFVLFYAVNSNAPLDDRHLGAFAQQVGLFNVWPYWREFVQSMTTRMGLPTLTLPLIKWGADSEDAEKPKAEPKRRRR